MNLPGFQMNVIGSVGRNFAEKHLMSAARLSRMCGEYEEEYRGDNQDAMTVHLPVQFAYVSASVLLSVASAEAHVNEMLLRPEEAFSEKSEDDARRLAEKYEWDKTIPKYQAILGFRGKEPLPEGDGIVPSMKNLIDLRNALTHPKTLIVTPENDYSQGKKGTTQGLVSCLRGKFELNPFVPESRHDLYPYISYGCAKWAVQTARQFMEKFREQADLPLDCFEKFGEQLDPRHSADRS